MNTNICPKCNATFDQSKKFCGKCGVPLVAGTTTSDTPAAPSQSAHDVIQPEMSLTVPKHHKSFVFIGIVAAVLIAVVGYFGYASLKDNKRIADSMSRGRSPSVNAPTASQTFPKPTGAVNDFAGVIDASSAQKMENLSREVFEKTGTSVVVAVMKSIGDENPNDYANRLYQNWGIGKKGEDKGVLLFLALKERKIRIETGYGVAGILTDGLAGEILDRYVVPYLKSGEYGKGLETGLIAVASVIAKDAHVALSGAPSPSRP